MEGIQANRSRFMISKVGLIVVILSAFLVGYSVIVLSRPQQFGYLSGNNAISTLGSVSKQTSSHSIEIERLPCNIVALFNSTTNHSSSANETNALHFRVNLESFHCQLERNAARRNQEPEAFVPFVYFDILECPPAYESSTFHVSASTETTLFMGWVGPRYAVKDGCGIYNAKVPVVEKQEIVSVFLYWTSRKRSYSNRVSDIHWAHHAKSIVDNGNLTIADIRNHIGKDQIDYLQTHLEAIPGMPCTFMFDHSGNKYTSFDQEKLPHCSEVPISSWVPAGVHYHEDDLHPEENWPFASARCSFREMELTELNDKLRGMRIKFLQDSHGNFINEVFREIMCPEVSSGDYFEAHSDCPNHTHNFAVCYRFFRAVYNSAEFVSDFDHLSVALRQGSLKSCKGLLGIGLFNATIIAIPTWIFVYETREGWDNFITSIESLLNNCKAAFPDLYRNHIVLLQTTTAIESIPFDDLTESWRGIHNYNIEHVSALLLDRLGGLVDGIIPVFDMTFAKSNFIPTFSDNVHLVGTGYRYIAQAQAAAVISAMKYRNMKNTLTDPRWFAGLPPE